MTVSLYLNHKTWVHRLDGRTKILVVFGFFMLALCFSHPSYLLAVLAIMSGGLAVARAGVNVKKMGMLAALLVCYSVILWPFFVEGKTPIASFHVLGVTWEGCMLGLGMGVRLLIMLWGGVLLLSTTTIEELTQASEQLGIPSRVAFAFALAFRWMGILLGAGVGVIQAQRSRGLDISSGSIIERVRKYVPLVVPLIGHALRQTNLLAMALESKGFHPAAHRSCHETRKMKWADFTVLVLLTALLGVTTWMWWQGIGTLDVRF